MKILFGGLFGIDVLVAAVVVYFFLWGLSDGTVSSFNIAIWLVLRCGCGGVLGGALWLRSIGQNAAAIGVSLVLAVPAILFGLFLMLFVLGGSSMH